jgi:uncharacterized protein DUF6666
MTMRSHGMGRLVGLGCGLVAASSIVGIALAQSDNYDSTSSRTRIRYGMVRDTAAGIDDGQSDSSTDAPPPATHGRWLPTRGDQTSPFAPKNAATEPDPEPVHRPRHKIESPRAGSKTDTPKEDVTDDGPKLDAPANPQPDSPRRPASRRTNTRSDVVRSSYSPAASQDGYSSSPPPAQPRRPTGWVESMTQQFSPSRYDNRYATAASPSSQRFDSPYGYYPRRTRLAMADQSVITHPSDPQPMDSAMHPGEELPPGAHMGSGHMEMGPPHGEWIDGEGPPGGCADGSCGYSGGDECGSCGACCCRPLCALLNCPSLNEWCQDLSVYTGEQGFLGPIDQGLNGNFGFHEGINFGTPLWDEFGLGAQVGFEADQSDLSGIFSGDTTHSRRQYFFTTGLFHTPQCGCGLQGGLVWDYLNDNSLDDFTVSQLRGDLSYVFNCNEIGFWFTAGVSDKTLISSHNVNLVRSTVTYSPIDLYAFYFGHKFCSGAEGRIWGGWTGGGLGGLFGADFSVPMGEQLSLDADFNYRIPNSLPNNAVPLENWNIALSVVWRPWHHGCGECCDSYRPLFNVANNGSLMVNRKATPIPVPGD